MAIVDRHTDAAAHQYVGAGQPCRTGTDDGDALTDRFNVADVRRPAHRQRPIRDIPFDIPDGYRP